MRRFQPIRTVLNGVQAAGWGTAMSVADFQHKTLILATAGMAAGDVAVFKVAISNADTQPTFSSAAAYNNPWSYVRFRDLATGTVSNSSGVTLTFSSAQFINHYAIEDDNAKWVNVQLSSLTDADASASLYAYLSVANDDE